MNEHSLLENRKEGWSFNGIDKNGRVVRLKKAHYFRNGQSLCGKYKMVKNDTLLPLRAVWKNEACKFCWKVAHLTKKNETVEVE